MNTHSVANLFPMMLDDEYRALVDDIRQCGQREPIWTLDGAILDGRNRYRACVELGVAPQVRTYTGPTDMPSLIRFVMSLNMHRRHLTSSQRGALSVEIEALLAEEARKRQLAGLKQNNTTVPEIFPEREYGEAREQAAQIAGTNSRYVTDAKKIATTAPDLFDRVKTGAITIPEAKREMRQREQVEAREARLVQVQSLPPEARIDHADTLDGVRDNSVPLIVTDPPYGISTYGGVTKVGDQLVTADFDGSAEWDTVDPAAFLDRLYDWCEAWERVLVPGGAVVAFTDRALVSHLWDALRKVDLRPKNILTWVKTNPSPAGLARRNLISATEYMVWAVKPGAPYVFNDTPLWDRRNVLITPIIGGHERVDHPTQKPLAVLKPLIDCFSNPGDLVLDPFAGSGSTGVAALALHRHAHLIEQDAAYVALARERLAACKDAA